MTADRPVRFADLGRKLQSSYRIASTTRRLRRHGRDRRHTPARDQRPAPARRARPDGACPDRLPHQATRALRGAHLVRLRDARRARRPRPERARPGARRTHRDHGRRVRGMAGRGPGGAGARSGRLRHLSDRVARRARTPAARRRRRGVRRRGPGIPRQGDAPAGPLPGAAARGDRRRQCAAGLRAPSARALALAAGGSAGRPARLARGEGRRRRARRSGLHRLHLGHHGGSEGRPGRTRAAPRRRGQPPDALPRARRAATYRDLPAALPRARPGRRDHAATDRRAGPALRRGSRRPGHDAVRSRADGARDRAALPAEVRCRRAGRHPQHQPVEGRRVRSRDAHRTVARARPLGRHRECVARRVGRDRTGRRAAPGALQARLRPVAARAVRRRAPACRHRRALAGLATFARSTARPRRPARSCPVNGVPTRARETSANSPTAGR